MMKPKPIFWLFSILILIIDQLSKWWIVKTLSLHQDKIIIPDFFTITYVLNDGIAFGLFQGNNRLFGLVAILILVVGIWWAKELDWKKKEVNVIGAMIIAGALGNLIDRIRVGHVIDFLDFHWYEIYHWPSFNIADSCITLSVVYIILRSLIIKPKLS